MIVPIKQLGPLALLAARAPEFGARVIGMTRDRLELEVPLPRSDGRCPMYMITAIETDNLVVAARETKKLHLPSACPERHINSNSTFCLGWDQVDRIEVRDADAAWDWWATLVGFLRLQERAARLRRWPNARVWAHGDAAIHQQQAMRAAEQLGPWFAEQLEAGRLSVTQMPGTGNGPALRVKSAGKRLYDIWRDHRRVVNTRGPCVCPKGQGRRPVIFRSCGEHARAAVDLAIALRAWEKEEARFWNNLKDQRCCGTMDNCPLANAA